MKNRWFIGSLVMAWVGLVWISTTTMVRGDDEVPQTCEDFNQQYATTQSACKNPFPFGPPLQPDGPKTYPPKDDEEKKKKKTKCGCPPEVSLATVTGQSGSVMPGNFCKTVTIPGSPCFVTLDRSEMVIPVPDGGTSKAPSGCSSCSGGGPDMAGGDLLRLEWWRYYLSRMKIPEASFGNGRDMYSGYDYRLIFTDATHLHLYDPTTQQEIDYQKNADGSWSEGWNVKRGTVITESTDTNVTVRYPGGFKLRFEITGYASTLPWTNRRTRLSYLEDRRGNRINFTYVLPASDATKDVMKWASISDVFGRTIQVTYTIFQNANVISQVTLPDGRQINYQYDPTKNGRFVNRIDYGNGLASTWNDVGAQWSGVHIYNEALLEAHNYKETLTATPNDGMVKTINRGDGTFRFSCISQAVSGTPAKVLCRFWINGVVREVEQVFSTSYAIGADNVSYKRVDGSWSAQEKFTAADREPMNKEELPDQRVTNLTLDKNFHKPTKITEADGTSEDFTYNQFTQPLTHSVGNDYQETHTYDASGNMLTHTVAVGKPEEATESWTYDAHGLCLTHTDFNSLVTTYTYDANGYLHTVTTPASDGQPAGTTTYNYDICGRLINMTDPVGHTTSYTYDNLNRCVSIAYADGSTETTTYGTGEFSARVLETKDRNNNRTAYTYDNAGRVSKIERIDGTTGATLSTTNNAYNTITGRLISEDRDGDVTTYSHDFMGRLISTAVMPKGGVTLTTTTEYDRVSNYDLDRIKSITDGYGRKTSFTYDVMDRVLTQSRELTPGGTKLTTTYEYDPYGNITAVINPKGTRNTYEYDARNRVTTEHLAVGSPEAASISYTYDANSNRLTKVDENGKTWTYTYTTLNKLRTTTDPLGHGNTYEYNADGLTHKVTNANGHDTTYTYANCCGHPTTITNADGTFTTLQYDFNGNVTQETDEEGNSVAYQYDGLGRKTKTILDPGGLNLTTTYTFNATPGAIGTTVTVTSPSGQAITIANDGMGRTSEVSGDTPQLTYAYDTLQQGYVQTTVTDALGNTSSSLADGGGRTVKVTDALGKNTTMQYDEDGNRTGLTDRDGKITASMFDARNRLTRTTQDSGGVSAQTNYQYDAGGQLTQLTDAQNNVTKYEYDDAGRQTSATYAFGTAEAKTWSYTYLPLGQTDTITKPDAATVVNAYDARERLITRTYSNAAAPDTFSYYANGLLKTAVSGIYGTTVDRSAGIGVSYDTAGRLIAESQNAGNGAKTVGFTYTPDSLTDTITYPSGRVLHQTYTTWRELNAVQLDGAAIVSSHEYDNAGRLTQRNYANGKVANWTFDTNNRMTEVDHVGVQKYDYTYSDEGDPLTQTDVTSAPGSEGYTYDGMHRLATMNRGDQGQPDFSQSWTLDKVGNWTGFNDNGTNETRTHNALNQITVRAGAALAYDANGNQTDGGDKYTMVYDPNNRLKEVREKASGTVVGSYKYDALGRRVERTALIPVDGAIVTSHTTRYCYAGQRIVEEYNENNLLQAVYTYGQYIDEPLSMDHVPTAQSAGQPAPTSTPTPTPSGSPTAVPTGTATAVPTGTATAVPTETALPLLTPSPSATPNTPTPNPSPTATETPDPMMMLDTPTPVPSATATETPDPMMQATPTETPFLPPTETPEPSPTPDFTPVASPTPFPTATAAPTASPTAVATPTITVVPTITPIPTATESAPLPTETPEPTATPDPMFPLTPTPEPTATATPDPMGETPIPTETPMSGDTPTPTAMPSGTPTVILTGSPTVAPTASPTPTTPTQQPLKRYYFHANRLYNVVALTDEAGNVVERYHYDAYGLCTTFDATGDNPMAYSRVGNPFTFTGRELDPETDFMHYRARTYSPKQGRFLQTDPIEYEAGLNLYEYTNSCPQYYVDPSGNAGGPPLQVDVDLGDIGNKGDRALVETFDNGRGEISISAKCKDAYNKENEIDRYHKEPGGQWERMDTHGVKDVDISNSGRAKRLAKWAENTKKQMDEVQAGRLPYGKFKKMMKVLMLLVFIDTAINNFKNLDCCDPQEALDEIKKFKNGNSNEWLVKAQIISFINCLTNGSPGAGAANIVVLYTEMK